MAFLVTEEKLIELLKEAWRDGYQSGVAGASNERYEERDFEAFRVKQIAEKAAIA